MKPNSTCQNTIHTSIDVSTHHAHTFLPVATLADTSQISPPPMLAGAEQSSRSVALNTVEKSDPPPLQQGDLCDTNQGWEGNGLTPFPTYQTYITAYWKFFVGAFFCKDNQGYRRNFTPLTRYFTLLNTTLP